MPVGPTINNWGEAVLVSLTTALLTSSRSSRP
jgi:hypothetical protein